MIFIDKKIPLYFFIQDKKRRYYLFKFLTKELILYPKTTIFSLSQIMRKIGYWAHTNRRVVHVCVAEVATRIHNEHDSIGSVRRRRKSLVIITD